MPRNTNKTAVSGATWRYGPILGDSFSATSHCLIVRSTRAQLSCSYKLVPLADHVAVFVHHRVPAGHLAHAFPEGPTVTHVASVLHMIAVGVLDLTLSGLALVPVGPLVWCQELLDGFRHRAVVTLLGNEPTLPARLVPVEILIRRVELQTTQVRHQTQTDGPGPVAFLERRIVTRNAPRPYRCHRR